MGRLSRCSTTCPLEEVQGVLQVDETERTSQLLWRGSYSRSSATGLGPAALGQHVAAKCLGNLGRRDSHLVLFLAVDVLGASAKGQFLFHAGEKATHQPKLYRIRVASGESASSALQPPPWKSEPNQKAALPFSISTAEVCSGLGIVSLYRWLPGIETV